MRAQRGLRDSGVEGSRLYAGSIGWRRWGHVGLGWQRRPSVLVTEADSKVARAVASGLLLKVSGFLLWLALFSALCAKGPFVLRNSSLVMHVSASTRIGAVSVVASSRLCVGLRSETFLDQAAIETGARKPKRTSSTSGGGRRC